MKVKWNQIVSVGSVGLLFSGCFAADKKNASETPSIPTLQKSITEVTTTPEFVETLQCYRDEYLPERSTVDQVDMLFVLDTSGSMNDEFPKITRSIERFIETLPEMDIHIAVALAHGKRSSYYGKLFERNRAGGVIDVSVIGKAQAKSNLQTLLGTSVPSDRTTDGGEVGLAALMGLLQTENFTRIQQEGFFRKDAALLVVFAADENDLCAVYPDGVTPVFDYEYNEPAAKLRECVWMGQPLTEETVYNELSKLYSDRPFLVSGFIYTDPTQVPRGVENEVGYGYSDIIERAKGQAYNLADNDYTAAMTDLGLLTRETIQYPNRFTLQVNHAIDPNTIGVWVDGLRVSHDYNANTQQVLIQQCDAMGDQTWVEYCEETVSTATPTPTPTQNGDWNPCLDGRDCTVLGD